MPTSSETMSLADLVSAAFAADHSAPPCFYWNHCGQRATIEKGGRSVCRHCADKLRGAEYPLRNPCAESLYASSQLAAEALDMLEESSAAGNRSTLDGADTTDFD